jgi:hypothetical protein
MSQSLHNDLVQAVDYLVKGGLEYPRIDDYVANLISRNHTALGYSSEVKLQEDLRDKPYSTLLQILINLGH